MAYGPVNRLSQQMRSMPNRDIGLCDAARLVQFGRAGVAATAGISLKTEN
jgi:hypothetical protein